MFLPKKNKNKKIKCLGCSLLWRTDALEVPSNFWVWNNKQAAKRTKRLAKYQYLLWHHKGLDWKRSFCLRGFLLFRQTLFVWTKENQVYYKGLISKTFDWFDERKCLFHLIEHIELGWCEVICFQYWGPEGRWHRACRTWAQQQQQQQTGAATVLGSSRTPDPTVHHVPVIWILMLADRMEKGWPPRRRPACFITLRDEGRVSLST